MKGQLRPVGGHGHVLEPLAAGGTVGRRAEALQSAEEAAGLYRGLAAGNRDAYLPDLAASVNNLANRLAEVGRRAEALHAAAEAVAMYQELIERDAKPFMEARARSERVVKALQDREERQ